MGVNESEDRQVDEDSRLDLNALVALAAHKGAALILPRRDGAGLGLRISALAARLIAEHLLSMGGVGLGDVLCFWARRAVGGRTSLVFVVRRSIPDGSLVIDLKDSEVRVRREGEADEGAR